MAETKTAIANKPTWVDLATTDAAASREFYSKVFGWKIEVNPDPQYGGYGMAEVGGKRVAGIGPKMTPEAPTAWSVYISTDDADALAKKVQAAGGKVLAPPFDVGDQGRMATFADPSGAVIAAWQAGAMNSPMPVGEANTFGWAELNARGVDKAIPFYQKVFGWTVKTSDMGPDSPPYNEFQLGGESIAGGTEMNKMAPAQMPSYWLVYFTVADVDKSFKAATQAGAREMLAPMDFPGGRFAIVSDPQGAAFGILKMAPAPA
ncbi:MAG TPA: VOC family protein [Candidatus Dormibacteraeota bacterium]|nr:VOC family protein [Candidatus Dormibacteraeota bacterium]